MTKNEARKAADEAYAEAARIGRHGGSGQPGYYDALNRGVRAEMQANALEAAIEGACSYCAAADCAHCGGDGIMGTHYDPRLDRSYPLCMCCYQSPSPTV